MPRNECRLTLFITGGSTRAKRATQNLQRICEQYLNGRYELDIVDVLENPSRAEAANVMATPTLIKELPPPVRRVIGDLTDEEVVLGALDIDVHRERKEASE